MFFHAVDILNELQLRYSSFNTYLQTKSSKGYSEEYLHYNSPCLHVHRHMTVNEPRGIVGVYKIAIQSFPVNCWSGVMLCAVDN